MLFEHALFCLHIMLSIQICHQACLPTPSSYGSVISFGILLSSPLPTHTQSKHAPRPLSASPGQPSHKQHPLLTSSADIRNLHSPLCLQPQSTSQSASLSPSLPPLSPSLLSINSKRIWKPAGCVMTLPLKTYSTRIVTADGHPACRWIDSCRPTSSMQIDRWL